MNEIPLTERSGGCGCGCGHNEVPVLDARELAPAIRHGAILGAIDSLQRGASLVLIAPHDPLPLLAQIRERHGDAIAVEYLERGPEWKLQLTRA